VSEDARIGFLSQIHGETLNESNNVYKEMEEIGFDTKAQIADYLAGYCFDEDHLDRKVDVLSGGEKNLLQLAKIGCGDANLLLLDEPTSHLDTYSQLALEKALAEYKGAVLMVSHDFYSIAKLITIYETGEYFPSEKIVLLNRKLLIRYTYQTILNA
jgi:ATP-binding cassette subfamily F protein 3